MAKKQKRLTKSKVKPYVQVAQRVYERGGEVEIDDDARVMLVHTKPPGAWVAAWVWVKRSDVNKQIRVPIVCETEGCPRRGKLINAITMPAADEDKFFEGFGSGGEDPEDYCKKCGELGVAQDPESA